jgi:hypothetical protein
MYVYRLAGGLFPASLRVRKCAVGMLTWEIDYEHIGEQPHRTDLEAIEATSKKHNVVKQGEYALFIANNEGYKAQFDQMADRYAEHVRTMIANHSTWAGVPAWAKATHRNAGELPAKMLLARFFFGTDFCFWNRCMRRSTGLVGRYGAQTSLAACDRRAKQL